VLCRRTTFVVGAGASKSYHLPTAGDLFKEASGLARHYGDPRELNAIYELLLCCDVSPEVLHDALIDLKAHGGPSIDQYVQQRQRFQPQFANVGKLLIAALLGRDIKKHKPTNPSDDDWIRELVQSISAGVPLATEFADIARKELRFVTFNFDSIIEERTAERIKATFGSQVDTQLAIESIRVDHVHGTIKTPPDETMYIGNSRYQNGYTDSGISGAWIDWTKDAAERIHLTQDEIDPNLLAEIHGLIEQSEVVCFLGFRYERENLDKLGLVPAFRKGGQLQFGSACGLSEGERTRVLNMSGQTIHLAVPTHQCLATLRQFPVIRDY